MSKIPGGLFDNGLPVGILMFLGTAFAVLRRRIGRKRAAARFPALASALGLEHTPPRYAGNVGVLTGTHGGRNVRVDPDDQRLIKVRFHGAPRIDLRTYENSLRPPFDMVTVHTGDREFDRFFKTRFACEDVAAQIATASEPGQRLRPFMGRYARHVQSITVTAEGVVCRLDFGSPPYIPEGALHELLPACVALADLLEPSDAAASVSSPPPPASVSGDAHDIAE
ncbi:MAG TPA: hypothetical protein VMG12_04795 [Polyangiaceae bacterium]|nr:hypothetical protein [Polyangiaceae bacterium]